MHSTIVVPGLLDWPVSTLATVEKEAPALARLIAAASSPSIEEDGLVAEFLAALFDAFLRSHPGGQRGRRSDTVHGPINPPEDEVGFVVQITTPS